jgi:hypothetical protein
LWGTASAIRSRHSHGGIGAVQLGPAAPRPCSGHGPQGRIRRCTSRRPKPGPPPAAPAERPGPPDHLADKAVVLVTLVPLDDDRGAMDQAGQVAPDTLPKAWPFSGASTPCSRTLCCWWLPSRTVMVSPSLTLTTRPTSVSARTLDARSSRARNAVRMGGIIPPSVAGPHLALHRVGGL